MTNIDSLIQSCIDLEGALRVLRERDNTEVRERVTDAAQALASKLRGLFHDEETPAIISEAGAEETSLYAAEGTNPEDTEAEEPPHHAIESNEDATDAPSLHEAAPQESSNNHIEIKGATSSGPNTKLLRAFTLNDRFRFCRALFAGNDGDFTDTLRLLADMDCYAEAEDYLLNDLLWDSRDEAAAEFLSILAENMPQ